MRATDLARDFEGVIDEVRIYNRALLLAEIQDLAGPCLGSQDLVIDETLSGTHVFEACNTISTGPNALVTGTGNVTARARKFIKFGAGFQVDPGGILVAEIDPTAGSS